MKIISINNTKIKINLALIPLVFFIYINGYIKEFLILFISLLIHELGHLIVAIIYDVEVKELNLFPLGAIIKFQYPLGIDPIKEIIISLAGPIVNLLFIFIFYIFLSGIMSSEYINIFIEINLILFCINILPIIPLDGGRVLRSILYMQGGMKFSTKYISVVSRINLTLILIIGLFFTKDVFEVLLLIGMILYLIKAAKGEREMAAFILTQSITRKKTTIENKRIIKAHFLIALKGANLKSILDIILPQRYNIIFIIDEDGRFLGKISEDKFFNGIIEYGCNEKIETLLFDNKTC